MLPLTFSCYFLAGYKACNQTLRRWGYERVLQRLLHTGSVTVLRKRINISEDGEQLLAASNVEYHQYEDDFVQICNLHTPREVNMSSWMSYTASLVNQDTVNCEQEKIFVVVQTRYVVDAAVRRTHPDLRVHVLSLGRPVAWKSSDNFDVIICCALPGLAHMVDAYGQDRLYLDEDLQIKGLRTISPSGEPQILYRKDSEGHSVPDVHTYNSGEATSATKDLHPNLQAGSIMSSVKDFVPGSIPASKKSTSITDGKSQSASRNPPRTESKSQSASSNPPRTEGKSQSGSSSPPKSDASTSERSHNKFNKPPNVLVYCGQGEVTGQAFASIKSSLEMCINTDVYIIYHLTHAEMLASPWVENTAVLLLSTSSKLADEVDQKIQDFVFRHGGFLLSFNSCAESAFVKKVTEPSLGLENLFTFNFEDGDITCMRGNYLYEADHRTSEIIISAPDSQDATSHPDHQKALVIKSTFDDGGVAILSQLMLERDPAHSAVDSGTFVALKNSNTGRLQCLKHLLSRLGMDVSPRANPELTPCCLLSRQQEIRNKFLKAAQQKMNSDGVVASARLSIAFLDHVDPCEQVSPSVLPVVTSSDKLDHRWATGFDEDDYWRHLQTSRLGQIVLYTDVIPSTMPVFDAMLFSLPEGVSPVAIAGRQTSGRGRGGNVWLSPLGCAMFTFPLSFDLSSEMGQRISFLQHLVSTAVVHGIRTLPGYQDLDLRLKWPNDIYYGKGMKLGGVIVTSTLMATTLYATVGCGVNVANSDPTICINDIIQLHNRSREANTKALPLLSPAGVIARTFTTLEHLLQDFERYGHLPFCHVYYKYWLHGGVRVDLQLDTEDGTGHGEIVGLDEYGFLSVRKSSGEVISVQPDGNSFDMMQNLVYCKRRL